jgi:hypothetical protein
MTDLNRLLSLSNRTEEGKQKIMRKALIEDKICAHFSLSASLEGSVTALFGERPGCAGAGVTKELLTPSSTIPKEFAKELSNEPRTPPIPAT